MSRVNFQPSTPPAAATTGRTTDLKDVDLNQFLTLMITELQNQDPLNPMDNAQFLQQISEIRQIGATTDLQKTMSAVFLGQNLSTASGLIGKQVSALSDDGKNVNGVVDRVSVSVNEKDESDRTIKIHIGDQQIDLKNVRELSKAA